MKKHKLLEWLQAHLRIQIGSLSEDVIGEVIVDNWRDFLTMVYESCGRVVEITWWEYSPIGGTAVSLGGGGPIDPKDPEYFWSELYFKNFSTTFSLDTTQEEVLRYVEYIIGKYAPDHMLSPAFTVFVQ